MSAWTAFFVLCTMAFPMEETKREQHAHSLCETARRSELPKTISPTIATQAYAVCIFVYGDMIDHGEPLRTCDEVIARLRPADPLAAMRVCKRAEAQSSEWAHGRF